MLSKELLKKKIVMPLPITNKCKWEEFPHVILKEALEMQDWFCYECESDITKEQFESSTNKYFDYPQHLRIIIKTRFEEVIKETIINIGWERGAFYISCSHHVLKDTYTQAHTTTINRTLGKIKKMIELIKPIALKETKEKAAQLKTQKQILTAFKEKGIELTVDEFGATHYTYNKGKKFSICISHRGNTNKPTFHIRDITGDYDLEDVMKFVEFVALSKGAIQEKLTGVK